MVDSIKNIGVVTPPSSTSKGQNYSADKVSDVAPSAPADKVEISAKALDMVAAEQAALDVQKSLTENPDVTLGLDASLFDEAV